MEIKSNNFLVTEPISKLMLKYAVPCIISLLVAALYNIVDQFFIANAQYLGSFGNAANTVVFPLTVIALAIAVLIGDGCCAYVSISLGANKFESAGKSIGNAVVLCCISSILLTFIYLIFADELITVFGGNVNAETFAFAKEYFFYITLGIPFYMFGQAINPIIRSNGSPRYAMFSTICGAIINIILDPLFIYVFKWGMMGAAVATVIGQIMTAVLAIYYLSKLRSCKLSYNSFILDIYVCKKTLALGMCSLLSQISLVTSMAAVNNMLRIYSSFDPIFSQATYAQIPMAVVGIVMKFFQIVISIAIGLAAGCIPIAGYNIGARREDSALKLFMYLIGLEGLVGGIALLIVEFFPRQLIMVFGAANESIYYTEFAIRSFRIYLCMMIFACINKGTFIYLQSLGKALASTVLSMIRELIFGVGLALLLPRFWGLDGILYSMPLADILTFILSFILIIQTYKSLKTTKPLS